MKDEELMQQALEALELHAKQYPHMVKGYTADAATALRERLAQPEQEPFCFHDGRNIVGKEYADHSDVFPLYTSPNPEQQKPVRFNCTVIDDAHLNGVPLSQWGKQHEMQPCAGRNCGSTNPNLHSAECFEDYEKSTGMAQPVKEPVAWQPIETAPKTGKKVILFYLNRNNFPRTVMARWLTDDEAAETDTDCVGLEGGWYECIDNWDDYTEVSIHEGEPTHWMPLPSYPITKEKPDAA